MTLYSQEWFTIKQSHWRIVFYWRFVVGVLFFVLFVGVLSATQSMATEIHAIPSGEEVMPADVLQEVQLFTQELEILRQYIGAPKAVALPILVNNAAPHDVYFQALTLFNKIDLLAFDITLKHRSKPSAMPTGVIKPSNVLALVQESHLTLAGIMAEFGVMDQHTLPEKRPDTQPAEVFQLILATNQQLNLLLRQPYAASDAYMQISKAIGYATILLTPYPQAIPIPEPSPFEPNKNPGDVYFRLLSCLTEISQIFATLGLSPLMIDAVKIDRDQIISSDLFDLASLVVARLDFLYKHQQLQQKEQLPVAYYPGRKFPADVYQRAGILLNQLQQLVQWTRPAVAVKPLSDEGS